VTVGHGSTLKNLIGIALLGEEEPSIRTKHLNAKEVVWGSQIFEFELRLKLPSEMAKEQSRG
jgi:hypothetical protein